MCTPKKGRYMIIENGLSLQGKNGNKFGGGQGKNNRNNGIFPLGLLY